MNILDLGFYWIIFFFWTHLEVKQLSENLSALKCCDQLWVLYQKTILSRRTSFLVYAKKCTVKYGHNKWMRSLVDFRSLVIDRQFSFLNSRAFRKNMLCLYNRLDRDKSFTLCLSCRTKAIFDKMNLLINKAKRL